jgi:hypothetical protein
MSLRGAHSRSRSLESRSRRVVKSTTGPLDSLTLSRSDLFRLLCVLAILIVGLLAVPTFSDIWRAAAGNTPTTSPPQGTWYFAVSGDSRDCGDLIMPKIAHAIEENRGNAPAEFYWHLGDLRRIFDIDCDIEKRKNPSFDCVHRGATPLTKDEMSDYLSEAWDDFIEHQIKPFGSMQVFIGIGNHELLAGRTRDDFRKKFQKWLTQEPLHGQRIADGAKGLLTEEGDTYYHFKKNGVDFISLDNADAKSFTADQVLWLSKLLKLDGEDASIKTIIVGMHEALPYSKSQSHAMDSSCQGLCSGEEVYEMLFRAQRLAGTPEQRKHVYVFCSHAHYLQEDIFNTPEHQGRVLPGWLVGTAGAEQYTNTIVYGYLQVEVRPDGTVNPQFKEVTRGMPPAASGLGANELTDFCFQDNKRGRSPDDRAKGDCACGAVK